MIQPAHRGIYEFLWSEHKNSVLSVSIKAFQGIASKLGKRPMLLALMKKFAEPSRFCRAGRKITRF